MGKHDFVYDEAKDTQIKTQETAKAEARALAEQRWIDSERKKQQRKMKQR